VSRGDDGARMIGINWGSSNFRAWRIDDDGRVTGEHSAPAGVAGLDRRGMAAMINSLVERWPNSGPIHVCGMIGSNVGWTEVPYAEAPVGASELAAASIATEIGGVPVHIVPGIACRRASDGMPDILRGEEIELLGLSALGTADGLVALPGTHTKWVRLDKGRIEDFFTSMSGEMFDRLTAQGLLASIVEGEASDGEVFHEGVARALSRELGLGTLLFGARALVVRGMMTKNDAASYIRGLLIGSEIADARSVYPDLASAAIPLVGAEALCRLYVSALASIGVSACWVDSRDACLRGFTTLRDAARG
jgi:2-dehydro-3-deoxygalactonokinase